MKQAGTLKTRTWSRPIDEPTKIRLPAESAAHSLPQCHLAWLAAGSFEPIFQLGHLDVVERGLADLNMQRPGVQRRFTAPFAASELLQRKCPGFIQASRCYLRDVLDAVIVSEAHDASAWLAHGGSIP